MRVSVKRLLFFVAVVVAVLLVVWTAPQYVGVL